MIMSYFNEEYPNVCSGDDKKCDVCRQQTSGSQPSQSLNYTSDIRLLLKAIYETGECYGMTMPIEYLKGSKNKKISLLTKNSTYNKSNKPIEHFKKIHLYLQSLEILKSVKIDKNIIIYKISDFGKEIMNDSSIDLGSIDI